MRQMVHAGRVFREQDFSTWRRISDLAGMPDGRKLLAECAEIPAVRHLVRDNTGLHQLWSDLNDHAGSRYDELLADEPERVDGAAVG
jgi:hypothetical protein